jgi:hypothetical protein
MEKSYDGMDWSFLRRFILHDGEEDDEVNLV